MIDPSLSFDGCAFLDGIGGAGKPDDFILTFLLTKTVGAGMFCELFWRKGHAKIAQCLVKHVTSCGKLDESIGK
ncbi:hypothetical protein [Thalassospira sp. MCCC 1A03138]|uniref:hypothetical protein n=1 Tax=Thalassospira sp. MCCC 1A03138 TaxID=1470576 RepID=UPI000A1DAA90|nr:hypothetical protein [Thalassospira sp. MCCC 1A03138]OSQ32750.1 hypothetical protein TH468_04230 [Thalassospira sp. MCCC 1A03138]